MKTEQDGMDQLKQDEEASHQEPARLRRRRYLKQVAMVSALCLGYVCVGSSQVWPSPALYDLSLHNETFYGTTLVLTSADKDLTGSLLFFGCLCGSLVAGHIVHRLGRRRTVQLTTLPFTVGWLAVGFAPSVPLMLFGRTLLGAGSGMISVAVSVYVLEFADKEIRGALQMLPSIFISIGAQYTLWMGTVLSWFYLSFVCTIPPLLLGVVLFFLSESPSHLVVHGRYQEATAVLRRLRGCYANIDSEIEDLDAMNVEFKRGSWLLLLRGRMFRRLAIVLCIFILQQLCGTFVLIIQTGRVLQAAGAAMSPDTASGVVVGMRLAGSLVGCALLDHLGRRGCLIISSFINAVCFTLLGAFVFYTADNPAPTLGWVPMICVGVALFSLDLGIQAIPFILAVEYFPTAVRPYSSSVCSISFTLSGFAMLQMYSPLQEAFTQAGLYWFFAASSFMTVIFTFFCVTETKQMSIG